MQGTHRLFKVIAACDMSLRVTSHRIATQHGISDFAL
jgi:hypothetical protein